MGNKIEKIDLFLRYIEIFEKKIWDEDIKSQFIKDFYKSELVYQFAWPKWQKEAEIYFHNPILIETANLEIIRKLLTLNIRKDRFCDFHLDMMVKSGYMLQILKRLKELRNEIRGGIDAKDN